MGGRLLQQLVCDASRVNEKIAGVGGQAAAAAGVRRLAGQ